MTRSICLMIMALLFSAASPEASENVCVPCHESLVGKLEEPVKLWKKSVHAENGIYCDGCHGGDASDPANAMERSRGFIGVPNREAIPDVCGKCHVGIRNDYLQSAHGRALKRGGPTCVTCHGNHGVVRATIDIINEKTCSQCHTYERAARLKEAMAAVEKTIVTLDGRIRELKNRGIETESLEQRLFAGRNRYHTLFHDVNVEKVKQETISITHELDKIPPLLKTHYDHIRNRKIAGVGAVGACLMLALLFYLLRRTYEP